MVNSPKQTRIRDPRLQIFTWPGGPFLAHGCLARVHIKAAYLDGRYCYAKCLDGYYPPAGFSTKMTKITCKCPDAKGCEWQPQKPFIGCVGPCEQPLREFGSIKSFFKVKADYSLGIDIHRQSKRKDRRSHIGTILNAVVLEKGQR